MKKKEYLFLAGGFLMGIAVCAVVFIIAVVPWLSPMVGVVRGYKVGDTLNYPGMEMTEFSLLEQDRQVVIYVPAGQDVAALRPEVDKLLAQMEHVSALYCMVDAIPESDPAFAFQCMRVTQPDPLQKKSEYFVVDTSYKILYKASRLEDVASYLKEN